MPGGGLGVVTNAAKFIGLPVQRVLVEWMVEGLNGRT